MTGGLRAAVRRASRDPATSVIVGAILLTGVVLAGIVIYRLTFIPVQAENAEAAHMVEAGKDLAILRSALDGQLKNASVAPAAIPISMSKPGAPGGAGVIPSVISFHPGEASTEMWAHKLFLFTGDDSDAVGHPEQWNEIGEDCGNPCPLPDVRQIQSFRLRIEYPPGHTSHQKFYGNAVRLHVSDIGDDWAGNFTFSVEKEGSQANYTVQTQDAEDKVLYSNPVAYHLSSPVTPFWVDVMDPDYRFNKVLAAGAQPLFLSLEQDTPSGNEPWHAFFAITYTTTTGGGDFEPGSGVTKNNFHEDFASGALEYDAKNSYFVDQHFRLENGALILDQQEGAAFRVAPSFEAETRAGAVFVSLTLPSLIGQASSISGAGPATVYLTTEVQRQIIGQATNLTLELTTEFPFLWADLWRAELTRVSLAEGTQFNVTTTADSATLALWGPTPAPASEEFDIFVNFFQADVRVEVQV